MENSKLIYFDIAAVIIMAVSLMSFVYRLKARTPANRIYLSAILLVALTACAALAGDIYDQVLGSFSLAPAGPSSLRTLIELAYLTLKSLTAPAYMVLIATVSDTSHRLNQGALRRVLLWAPMLAVVALILTNPVHHLVFTYENGAIVRASGIMALHVSTIYYSLIGIGWLFRWHRVLDEDTFATLLMLYPLALSSAIIQYHLPYLSIETFATSVAMMLVSAFVIRPERQMDSLINAASLEAYRELTRRAFITGKPLCLVYLEIVNIERLRELVGKDELQDIIRGMANTLTSVLETGDVLFYLRNGLFCISPVNLSSDHALAICTRMNDEGKARAQRGPEGPASISMRCCVVRVPEDVESAETLATFTRRLGHLVPGPQVTTFAELSRRGDFDLNMALSAIIRDAIRDETFEVYYQPIYCVADGRFHSAEALVRLNDPTFGFVSPALFIPEAEQSGAIIAIGAILLKKICAFLAAIDFERSGLAYVEVNLSTEQCVRPQLAGELLSLIDDFGIEPSRLNLEITETSATFSQAIVEANVRTLAAAGITFSLDDYGTGYSNVTRALDLPFSLIKLDKSFVDNLDDERCAIACARSIQMMHEIGRKVLVEGVETEAQALALAEMGADYLQGYRFARPMPEADYTSFLVAHATSAPRV